MVRFTLFREEKPRYLILTSRIESQSSLVVDNTGQRSGNRLNFLLFRQKKKNYHNKSNSRILISKTQ